MGSRRRFITGVTAVATAAVAGCSSVPLIGSGPEDAVEQFYTAFVDGDVEAANEVLHPESAQYPVEEDDFEGENEDLTVTGTTQVSTRELVEWEIEQFGGSVDDISEEELEAEVESRAAEAEAVLDELNADDHAWVLLGFETDSEEQEVPVQAVEDDGEWYVLLR